jgi:hypothetical protein
VATDSVHFPFGIAETHNAQLGILFEAKCGKVSFKGIVA